MFSNIEIYVADRIDSCIFTSMTITLPRHVRYYSLCLCISADGYIHVNQDLSSEYSYVFSDIELCIADRRDSGICTTMTIKLSKYYYVLT